MQSTFLRRIAAPIAASAVIAGGIFAAAAPASADPASTDTTATEFKNACRASAAINVSKSVDSGVAIDAPATVEPGETFTYKMQVAPSFYPNSDTGATTTSVSRLKWDFEIPDNVEFVSAAVEGSGVNLAGTAPTVLRINDDGQPDEAGAFLRLSGDNAVIANGADNDTKSEGGILAPKLQKNIDGSASSNGDSHFQPPAVAVTVKAGQSGVIEPKVRTAGAAAEWDNDRNWNTFLPLASVPILGDQWAPTRCAPMDNKDGGALNAGAGPLARIGIGGAPGEAAATTTATLEANPTVDTPAENGGTPWWQWVAGLGAAAAVVALAIGLARRGKQ